MASRGVLSPKSAEFPSTNFPQFNIDGQRRPFLGFNDAAVETCYWTLIAPVGIVAAITLDITYRMATATTGYVQFEAAFEAISDDDALDTDAASSFAAYQESAGLLTVPGTAGYIDQTTITFTIVQADNIVAGDYVRIAFRRDATDATNDTATGDAEILAIELRDGA